MSRFCLGCALTLAVLAAIIIGTTRQALAVEVQIQQARTPAETTTRYGKAFLETITFGVYDGASAELAVITDHVVAWQRVRRVTMLATGAFILVGMLLLGSTLVSGRGRPPAQTWRWLGTQTLLLSGLLLVLGLSTPLVTTTVAGRIPGLGSTLLAASAKGVLTAIGDLWAGGQPLLAALVVCFSVVLPIIKLSLAGWILFSSRPSQRLIRLFQHVGKWAMADVFVVGVLIVLLSPLRQGLLIQTRVQAGIGLAFFAASCLLSMLLTLLLSRGGTAHAVVPDRAPQLLAAGDDA